MPSSENMMRLDRGSDLRRVFLDLVFFVPREVELGYERGRSRSLHFEMQKEFLLLSLLFRVSR